MLRYVDVKEVFSEIPNEITLAISISGCPIHCKGCHSKYLWKEKGKTLDWGALNALIHIHHGITCVLFSGGDNNPGDVDKLATHIRSSFPELKIAWYSGQEEISDDIDTVNFDYIKVGPYIEENGPLNSRTTNQVLWKFTRSENNPLVSQEDITSMFWKNV